jgi:peptidoglycan hydrolase-like protein with peptidoglycan-binding domain
MKTLQMLSFGADVKALQLNLKKLGYGNLSGTGFFGANTKFAVNTFQQSNGLPMTGIWTAKEQSRLSVLLSDLNRQKIYKTALSLIGKDASPNDLAPDEVGCADSVCSVLQKALGNEMGILYTVSTAQLYRELLASKEYMLVQVPKEGDILVSPTGLGNGNLSNGHTGIWGEGGKIMSNSSATGTFEQNFDDQHWKARYVALGGFPMVTFRKL